MYNKKRKELVRICETQLNYFNFNSSKYNK